MRVAIRRLCGALALGAVLAGCGTNVQTWLGPPEPPPTPVADQSPSSGSAMAVLQSLPVKGRAPKTGYGRDQFGQAWSDDVDVPGGHNGCDTRSDILRRDLQGVAIKAGTNGCVPVRGTLHDPYTGQIIDFTRGAETSSAVQIDHVVPLSDAWQTGAQLLTLQERQDLANDPLNLLAVDGPSNQAKGDSDAATWLPPARSYRCGYIAIQIAVKAKYRLWVTPAEHDAMQTVLSNCPDQAVPAGASR